MKVNLEEIAAREESRGQLGYRSRRLAAAAGGRALGCSWYELAPGQTSFPLHYHAAIEEAIYVLEGTGTARVGTDTVAIGPGDYLAFPAGPDAAHTVANTGAGPLRYLCMSGPATPATMDICVYPDSNKVAFLAGVEPGKGRDSAWIVKLIKQDVPAAGYYDDEPLAKP